MMQGTRTPPSVVYALYSLEGAVAAWAHLGPYQTNESKLPIFWYELL